MTRTAMSVRTGFKKVSHVIFDMDGLLLDTEGIYTRVISDLAKRFGKVYTRDLRVKVLGTVEVDTCKIAVKELQLPITWQEFQENFAYQSKQLLKFCPLMPGAEKLVRHLHYHRVPIAVATSSSEESMNYKTHHLTDFFSLFHHKVTGGSDPEVKRGKPSPDIFLVCASRFSDKPSPDKCLVFEDAPNGARGAIDAGMQCVLIPDSDVPLELCKHATQTLPSLNHLKLEQFGLPPFDF